MSENPGPTDPQDAEGGGDLFQSLPDPVRPAPASGITPPAPGSRRALREARAVAEGHGEEGAFGADAGALADAEIDPFAEAFAPAQEAPATATPGLDDLFTAPDRPNRREKRRGRGCLITLIVLLLLAGGATAAGFWVWENYGDRIKEVMGWADPKDFEPGQTGEEVLITIRQGDTGCSLSPALFEAGVTKTDDAFCDMLVKSEQSPLFYPGVYQLRTNMSSAEALAALQDPASKLENSVLLREGMTMARSLEIIAESLGIELAELEAAAANPKDHGVDADSLEGWIFPAMYTFDPGVTAGEVIERMVERTRQSLRTAEVAEKDWHSVLTIASIIQREARFEEDFYKVSRVIQNRLNPANKETFGLLQMDSTAHYGVGELEAGNLGSSDAARADDNPWNTYKHPGLPIGPIANPGDLAIDAAQNPVDGPWLYFVTTDPKKGTTVFTNSYREHLVQVEVWNKWCRANPDYSC